MNVTARVALFLAAAVFAAGGAWADWNDGYVKMHWPQWPDLTDTGLDVDATGFQPHTPNHLADDFQCTETGPITDIHIWGSFFQDEPPGGDPGGMVFRLSIHENIPDPDEPGSGEWSRPAMPPVWEWEFQPGEYTTRMWADNLQEGYWDPNDPTGANITPDTVCWQHNFFIDPALAFPQVKDEIYWLDVQAWDPSGTNARWGWKTTNPVETPHFEDDAVFWDEALPPFPDGGQWNELRYPDPSPFHPQSIDLAFVITPEPTTMVLAGVAGLALLRRRRR